MHGALGQRGSAPLLSLGIFSAPFTLEPIESSSQDRISALLPVVSLDAYDRAVESILQSIYEGDVYQVNLSVAHAFSIDGDPERLWGSVCRTTGANFQAFVTDGERHILSWSPEAFLIFDENRMCTQPMKGTAPLHDAASLHSEKNAAEHLMIVDLLRNDLHRVARDVSVEALGTLEHYPTFLTMTSRICATLNPATTFEQIIDAMLPCGSITGAPKRAAIEEIARLETTPRGVYCGTIGYLSPERQGWWNVAIRTAQVEGTCGIFHAGGGIVADSRADDEWNENTHENRLSARPLDSCRTHRDVFKRLPARLALCTPRTASRIGRRVRNRVRPRCVSVRARFRARGYSASHRSHPAARGRVVYVARRAAGHTTLARCRVPLARTRIERRSAFTTQNVVAPDPRSRLRVCARARLLQCPPAQRTRAVDRGLSHKSFHRARRRALDAAACMRGASGDSSLAHRIGRTCPRTRTHVHRPHLGGRNIRRKLRTRLTSRTIGTYR